MVISTIRPWLKFTGVFISLSWHLGWLLLISSIKGKSVERGFRYRRNFCRSALSILGVQYTHEGTQYKEVCLYVSNHRSLLDPLVQLAYFDAFIVSKAEVGGYPVLGRGAKETGIILVERDNHQSRKSALDSIEQTLLSGYPVLIYPEGTTHGGSLTGDFKRGAFELANKLGVPVVPIMIEYPGPEYYYLDGTLLKYFIGIFSSSQKLMVHGKTGEAIIPGHETQLLEKTKSRIDAMIQECRKHRLNLTSKIHKGTSRI